MGLTANQMQEKQNNRKPEDRCTENIQTDTQRKKNKATNRPGKRGHAGQSPISGLRVTGVLEGETERWTEPISEERTAETTIFQDELGPSAHNPESSVRQVRRKTHTRKTNLRCTTAEPWKVIFSK